MSGLQIIGVSFSATEYNPGDLIVLTINYKQTSATGGTGLTVYQFTGTFTDSVTGVIETLTENFSVNVGATPVPDPFSIIGTDDRPVPGEWAVYSNTMNSDGTGSAVLTSTA